MKLLADILADAREYIEEHGWWRGHNRGPNGRQVCSRGAIIYSQGWNERHMTMEQCEVYASLEELLMEAAGDGDVEITAWNDDKAGAKNKQHVLDTFAKAEKIARTGFDPDYPDKARFDPEAG